MEASCVSYVAGFFALHRLGSFNNEVYAVLVIALAFVHFSFKPH